MPEGHWIAHVDVDDMETYKRYTAANAVPFAEFGARFLVRGAKQEVRDAQSRRRTLVLEFDSYEQAVACSECPGYQDAKASATRFRPAIRLSSIGY